MSGNEQKNMALSQCMITWMSSMFRV